MDDSETSFQCVVEFVLANFATFEELKLHLLLARKVHFYSTNSQKLQSVFKEKFIDNE